jgi:ssDNA thymidine ADP-ribosyltransferase, DarT
MDRSDVRELYFIALISNVPSILEWGILSHNKSLRLPHDDSIAMPEVQEKRKAKKIPGTNKKLHDYANLYFDAHNPMLCKRRDLNDRICVLRVDSSVLELQNVVIADQNAASNWVRFYPKEEGLAAIDKDRLFARYWTHPGNQIEEWVHSSAKCAEVLVPNMIEPSYILGAFVANQTASEAFGRLNCELTVCIRSDIFF